MPWYVGNPEHLEEVEGWAKPAGDGGDEEAWPAVDHVAEVAARDAGLAEEEGDGMGEIGWRRCEDLRAHAGDPADLWQGKA